MSINPAAPKALVVNISKPTKQNEMTGLLIAGSSFYRLSADSACPPPPISAISWLPSVAFQKAEMRPAFFDQAFGFEDRDKEEIRAR